MRGKKLAIGLRATLAILTVTLFVTSAWAATQERALHDSNPNGTDGKSPNGGLLMDAAGNLYGTTNQGGDHNFGTVFALTPAKDGSWTEKVLRSFSLNGTDGRFPSAGLVLDASGNLYGATSYGGAYGGGSVFELTHEKGGWTEKVLHSFGKDADGNAAAGLISDAVGNLYGTTTAGGAYGAGTVFQLTPTKDGGWMETVLHSFNNNGACPPSLICTVNGAQPSRSPGKATDGYQPSAGLVIDASGNLYGTTLYGGTYNSGTVFELKPTKGGPWTEELLHSFNNNGTDGYDPGGLVIDAAGNLYGTTGRGSTEGCSTIRATANSSMCFGMVFELTPAKGGGWTEKALHNFNSNGTDGTYPGGLILDAAGNLYGTTGGGGAYDAGTVFELTPNASGSWTEKVLHAFNPDDGDGASPAGLIVDANGNLYGTTLEGGAHGQGTVFELTPKADGGWTEEVLHSFYTVWYGNPPKAQSASPTVSPDQSHASSETAHSSKSAGIRGVDFRNFDYPFDCKEKFGEGDACDLGFDKVIHVSDGEWMKGGSDETPEILHFRIGKIIYGDLQGDGRDEAVVVVGYGGQWNWEASRIYVFAMSSNGPQLLAQLLSSDWDKGEEETDWGIDADGVYVSNGKLVVSFSQGGPHCCPAWRVAAELEWNGRQFTRNGNVGLSIGADSYRLISGEAKWPLLSVECTRKGTKTEHHLTFSPSAYSSLPTSGAEVFDPMQPPPGGQRTFNMTIGGIKQATTWVSSGDTGTFTHFGRTEPERLKFIQSLLSSESVSIEFTPFKGVPTTSVFDLSRLRDGIEKHPQCAMK